VIAGGTALLLMIKSGLYEPRRLVSLHAWPHAAPTGGLEIGAMVRPRRTGTLGGGPADGAICGREKGGGAEPCPPAPTTPRALV